MGFCPVQICSQLIPAGPLSPRQAHSPSPPHKIPTTFAFLLHHPLTTFSISPSKQINMAAAHLILSTLFLLSPLIVAQTAAPAPAPSPTNITAILEKAGQYTIFIKMIKDTQTETQIINQLNNSNNGMTCFAPTNDAFKNLPPATLNNLNDQKKVQLIQFHICPKFYSLSDLEVVSNPVPTQAGNWGLYFSGSNNQVNISSGNITTQVTNALSGKPPLAVYQVDKVLIPAKLNEKAATPSASPAPKSSTKSNSSSEASDSSADAPSGSAAGGRSMGLGLVVGLVMVCIGALTS